MRERLGVGHAVALETGGEDENVRARIEGLQLLRRYGAGNRYALAKIEPRDVRGEARGGPGVPLEVACDRQPPGEIAKVGERGDQHVMALAGNHGADAQQRERGFAGPPRARLPIAAWPHDFHAIGGDAELGGEEPRGERARRDHAPRAAERRRLADSQPLGNVPRETCLQGERVMDESDQMVARAEFAHFFGQRAKGEPVDDDRHARWRLGNSRARKLSRLFARKREALADVEQVDLPAHLAKQLDNAPIVGVTAGRNRQIPGHGEDDAPHHKGDSYQARAT